MSIETKPENPPAFPVLERFEKFDEDRGKYVEYHLPAEGMTLRDYFAAKAMQAYIGRLGSPVFQEGTDPRLLKVDLDYPAVSPEAGAKIRSAVAVIAYEYADAMLKERSKP